MNIYSGQVKFEFNANAYGQCYLIIYGKHINGGFCCIPNHGKGCEMSTPDDVFYNTERLIGCGLEERVAESLARQIAEVSKQIEGAK